ncbi:hypothetical protein NGR_b14180 (plasmid) [Sinorhizobium fredii NGR234]|uniref:Uncharacterized protein n=1 Tax=Sinorhizobium fredii (strain NBRC 101917 / NGR234) TaxID=394 RepID=C3KKD3_SINFN|nr:hypothetical protein NGR_b14180 [Sinorhizobium fredii NGR234]
MLVSLLEPSRPRAHPPAITAEDRILSLREHFPLRSSLLRDAPLQPFSRQVQVQ